MSNALLDSDDGDDGFLESLLREWRPMVRKGLYLWFMGTMYLTFIMYMLVCALNAQMGFVPNAKYGGESRWMDLMAGPTWAMFLFMLLPACKSGFEKSPRENFAAAIWSLSYALVFCCGIGLGMTVFMSALTIWGVIELAAWCWRRA